METETIDIRVKNPRYAGVLAHPTSFPSRYGIGDLGDSAYRFIDFLEVSGQSIWQVLPLGPTGYGDSPYQSFSSFAGQPLILSPDKIAEMGLLSEDDLNTETHFDPYRIDYGSVIPFKYKLYEKAFQNFESGSFPEIKDAFNRFIKKQKAWLSDYALFMAAKDYHDGVAWPEWDPEISNATKENKKIWAKKLTKQMRFYKFLQYLFYEQWFAVKTYANDKKIKIVGDTPIFVAFDSADVWANRELFCLDKKGYPLSVAGVPPDYFSETGQLWGNPLYDWKAHKKTSYKWWIKKVAHTLKLVDYLRIDHFRGFEAYWSVPYGSENAIKGEWLKGPADDLFQAFEKALGTNLPIIAEDLGIITEEVEALRDNYNLPGMRILQFAFESIKEGTHLPHQFTPNTLCYTGTHDNDTTLSWYEGLSEVNKDKLRRYFNTDGSNVVWDMIRACYASVSKMAIIPLQDIMCLGNDARMNTPGIAQGNWQWRYDYEMIHQDMVNHLLYLAELFGRLPYEEEKDEDVPS